MLDIGVFGEVLNDRFKERKASRVGDLIYVTGKIGDGSLGLDLLRKKKRFTFKEKLIISKYKSPRARVKLGLFLGQLKFLTSMIDITDGLSLDLRRLLGPISSGRGATLIWEDIPKTDCISSPVSTSKLMKSVLSGGDDYELLFTIKKTRAKHFEDLCKKNNFKVFRIGFVDSTANLSLIRGGRAISLKSQGFVHRF
jgi:thiamine-monophosphate kinase